MGWGCDCLARHRPCSVWPCPPPWSDCVPRSSRLPLRPTWRNSEGSTRVFPTGSYGS
ncbi:hypothetical protein D187_002861 [Cystobacter fuscus DSM 2262]|uniref:Uncharacterized protein n=1 Tax=Cystobacter fuscus (strain ATCC 25194 / DSM 2262 / NBRC 100088 / M29) TaxID=1242864 RepID=S9P891_CYSF2|nr:hypothetical protein D187_002861 [Cystobacter fuscus DSM 2262]